MAALLPAPVSEVCDTCGDETGFLTRNPAAITCDRCYTAQFDRDKADSRVERDDDDRWA